MSKNAIIESMKRPYVNSLLRKVNESLLKSTPPDIAEMNGVMKLDTKTETIVVKDTPMVMPIATVKKSFDKRKSTNPDIYSLLGK